MIEQQIEFLLKDLVQLDYVVYDSDAVFVKFSTDHLHQGLMNEIQSRLSPLGMSATISNITTNIEAGVSKDTIILKVERSGNGYGGGRKLFDPKPFTRRFKWMSHPGFNLVLFIITFLVVFITGAATILNKAIADQWNLTTGFQFSLSLLGILMAHEFGHYFAAKYHKLEVTLPYFLPGILIPPGLFAGFGGTTLIPGTFGAFIKIKSPIKTRTQLMDVGAAGPIAGFIVCVAVLLYGFLTIPEKSYAYQFYDVNSLYDGNPTLFFGSSVLFSLFGSLAGVNMPAMYDIIHYPFIFAGWFGLLVTALNLLPIGQLDGGHITYALFGRNQKYLGYVVFAIILILGFGLDITSWIAWAILILVLIKIKHPPVMNENEPLDMKRKLIGVISIIIFILSFTPAPVYEKILTR